MKKIVFWTVVIFLGFYIFTQPHGAAALFAAPVHLLKSAGNEFGTFVRSL